MQSSDREASADGVRAQLREAVLLQVLHLVVADPSE